MGTFWRALTLKQPWAWAVSYAGKDVENRTWPVPPKIRCCKTGMVPPGSPCDECGGSGFFDIEDEPHRVMIHAGAAWDKDGAEPIQRLTGVHTIKWWAFTPCPEPHEPDDYERCPVCTSDEVDDWPLVRSAVVAVATITGSHNAGNCFYGEGGQCSPWAFHPNHDMTKPEMHHWELADVTVLDTSVPTGGFVGLWKPSTEIIRAVEAQL